MSAHLILFDCDGTLVDSQAHIVHTMQQAVAACGHRVPEVSAVRAIIGLSLEEAIGLLLPGTEALQRQQVMGYYRRQYATEADIRLYPGVIETLRHLKARGYWLGIVTGKSRRGLLRQLDEFGMDALFQVWRTADCCPSKPHPAMVLECMQEMGVGALQTTVVGDSRFDMQMAVASGVRALGVSFGVEPPEVLLDHGAAAVVDRFADLVALFPPLPRAGDMSTMAVAKEVK